MTKTQSTPTQIAAAALEQALNSVPTGEAIEVAEMLVVLSTAFLRGLSTPEYVRGFLEEGIRDLDRPPILKVICVKAPGTKH